MNHGVVTSFDCYYNSDVNRAPRGASARRIKPRATICQNCDDPPSCLPRGLGGRSDREHNAVAAASCWNTERRVYATTTTRYGSAVGGNNTRHEARNSDIAPDPSRATKRNSVRRSVYAFVVVCLPCHRKCWRPREIRIRLTREEIDVVD